LRRLDWHWVFGFTDTKNRFEDASKGLKSLLLVMKLLKQINVKSTKKNSKQNETHKFLLNVSTIFNTKLHWGAGNSPLFSFSLSLYIYLASAEAFSGG